jgi:3-oxoacyl-[acyl-carrier protein] reductase
MLQDRVAFVTGSTRGIGWATAEAFAAHGAILVLNGRSDAAALDARVADLRQRFGVECSGIFGDVSDPAVVKEAYRTIFGRHRRLDVLVNNAGILDDALLGMVSLESAQRTFAVNAMSVLLNMQAGSRLMMRGGSGSIINLSSIIGTHGNAGQVAYGGSKAAVIGMSLSAAKELAAANVRVNVVAPGFIDTEMARSLPPAKFEERVHSIKMARIGTPAEVANVILFLASGLSSYVTGQVIGVDGGMLI